MNHLQKFDKIAIYITINSTNSSPKYNPEEKLRNSSKANIMIPLNLSIHLQHWQQWQQLQHSQHNILTKIITPININI